MEPTEFFTWSFLATFTGAVAATGLLTHFLAELLDEHMHLPTRALAYMVALGVLLASLWFTGAFTVSNAVLALFNAAVVAMATSGAVDSWRQMKRS